EPSTIINPRRSGESGAVAHPRKPGLTTPEPFGVESFYDEVEIERPRRISAEPSPLRPGPRRVTAPRTVAKAEPPAAVVEMEAGDPLAEWHADSHTPAEQDWRTALATEIDEQPPTARDEARSARQRAGYQLPALADHAFALPEQAHNALAAEGWNE